MPETCSPAPAQPRYWPHRRAWLPVLGLLWAGALYWTGTELLENGGPKWAVTFPSTRLRYLRLTPAAPLRAPWTIAEIEALE